MFAVQIVPAFLVPMQEANHSVKRRLLRMREAERNNLKKSETYTEATSQNL